MRRVFGHALAVGALLAMTAASHAQTKVIWWDFLGGGDGIRMKKLITDFSDAPLDSIVRLNESAKARYAYLEPCFKVREGQVTDAIETPKGFIVFERLPGVMCRHIVVQWAGAKDSTQSRTEEEARKRAEEALEKARKGEDFQTLIRTYSDKANTVLAGDLGVFSREDMKMQGFADAAFALQPGGISDLVKTDFGYHIILRYE